MAHQIIGWLGLLVLAIIAYRITSKRVHAVNLKSDRDGANVRSGMIARFAFDLLAFNLVFGLLLHYLLPAFAMHAWGWTLLAQAIGVPFGFVIARLKVIRFYRRGDKWGNWTNFADFPIVEGDITWATSEHRFQADKFIGTDEVHRNAIRQTTDPKEAAKLGRDRAHPMRADWNMPAKVEYTGDNANLKEDWQRFCSTEMLVKDYSMLEAVRLKVRQHYKLCAELLATGDALFIEHTEKDNYWADGGDGTGRNMLGKIIMIVRAEESRRH